MSRSRRHTPASGITTTVSEADDKRLWHGRMRAHERAARAAVMAGADGDAYPPVRAVSDPWDMGKDGKRYHRAAYPELMRK